MRLEPLTEDAARNAGVNPPWAGFKIPYFNFDGKVDKDFWRYRFWPESRPSHGFAALAEASDLRYVQPVGTEPRIYMPPLLDGLSWRDIAASVEIPLYVTEGELKAACVCANTDCAMLGIGGVFSWMSKPRGLVLVPELEAFKWTGREVFIVFDSDRATKPMVQLAASRLAITLTDRGAVAYDVFLPPGPNNEKQGVDDLIVASGAEALTALCDDPETCVKVSYSLELHKLNDEVVFVWSGAAAGNVVRHDDALVMTPEKFARSYYRDRVYMKTAVVVNKDGDSKETHRMERAADAWLEWPQRAKVAGVTYAPGETKVTVANQFNMWRDDGVTPKRGDTQPFDDLVARMLTGVPQDHITWFLRWLAYPVQNPGAKLFSCALFWSYAGGTGKNLLAETMEPIYGPSNYVVIKSGHLLSEFNSWAEGKRFVVGDEIALDDKRRTSGDLKAMITSRVIRINRKGIEAYEVPDRANYYLTANEPVSISLDQGERRTFVHHAPETPLGDAYGRTYAKWLREQNGAAAVAWKLNNFQLGDFSPTAPPPETYAKDELIANSLSELDAWAAAVAADPEKWLTPRNSRASGTKSVVYTVYTVEDLMALYDPDGKTRANYRGLGLALSRAGFKKALHNNGRIGSYRATLWIMDKSIPGMTSTKAAERYKEERPDRFVPPSERDTTKKKQVRVQ